MKLDDQINKLWKSIPVPCRRAFFSALIIGFLDYLYTMTNHFLTFDSMWNLYSAQDMITSGRQFLTYACSISSYFDLPAVNGMLAVFYLAVTAAIVVQIFEIRSTLFSILTAGMIVTFPAVSSTFCYTYTVDGYMLALLLVTIAFALMDRFRFGWIAGAVLICLSLGIYQAYYSFVILLCILKLLSYLLYEKDMKTICVKAARYVFAGVAGYLLYALTLAIMLASKNATLSGYQGSDKVLGFDLGQLPVNVYRATRNFFSFLVSMNVLTATRAMKNALGVIFVIGAIAALYVFVKNKIYKNIVRILLILLLLAITPAATTLVMVMAPDSYFHVLMRMPWALFFVFVLSLTEKVCMESVSDEKKLPRSLKYVCSIVLTLGTVVMIFQFIVMQGIVAYNMNERYEKTYSLCNRIVDRLEQTDGYKFGEPVAILGGSTDPYHYPPTSITGSYVGWYFGVNGELCVSSTADFSEFCKHFLGVYFIPAEQSVADAILTDNDYIEMQSFPYKDSIRLIDDVWVVKLHD